MNGLIALLGFLTSCATLIITYNKLIREHVFVLYKDFIK